MSIDILVKHPGADLPPLPPGRARYVVAADGVFLERRTAMYATSARVPGPVAGLAPHGEHCRLACGRLPRAMTRAMLTFFRAAYQLHGGEAALVLLYDPARRTFRWHCPEQTVEVYTTYSGRTRAYDAVRFDTPLSVKPGFVVFGDAHSHGGLSAYPSGTDKEDESYKDGLHLIVGHLDRPGALDYHADFVMDGRRFTLDPEDVFEDPHCGPLPRAPASWLGQIRMTKAWSSYTSYSGDTRAGGLDNWRRY